MHMTHVMHIPVVVIALYPKHIQVGEERIQLILVIYIQQEYLTRLLHLSYALSDSAML